MSELTNFKARTALDPERSDLSGHPQFQRVSPIAKSTATAIATATATATALGSEGGST